MLSKEATFQGNPTMGQLATGKEGVAAIGLPSQNVNACKQARINRALISHPNFHPFQKFFFFSFESFFLELGLSFRGLSKNRKN